MPLSIPQPVARKAMTVLFPDGADGAALRDAALNLLRVRRAGLIRECTAAALRIALEAGELCADDVRDIVAIPSGISPKLMGPVFRDLADAGILRRDGYRNSKRRCAHARPLSVWRLADPAAAIARLAALKTVSN